MKIIILFLILIPSIVFAQQQPVDLQRQLELTRIQRNQFLDAFNDAAVKVDSLTAELAKAQTRIKELEAPKEPKQ